MFSMVRHLNVDTMPKLNIPPSGSLNNVKIFKDIFAGEISKFQKSANTHHAKNEILFENI